jgi:hypothetical protein
LLASLEQFVEADALEFGVCFPQQVGAKVQTTRSGGIDGGGSRRLRPLKLITLRYLRRYFCLQIARRSNGLRKSFPEAQEHPGRPPNFNPLFEQAAQNIYSDWPAIRLSVADTRLAGSWW